MASFLGLIWGWLVGWDALVSSIGLGFSANIGWIDTKRKTCCQKILVLEFLS
jgi:hypothetical protein